MPTTTTVTDWDCQNTNTPLSKKISDIFLLKGVHGDWILHEYEEIKGRYAPGEDPISIIKEGFTLQRRSTTIEIFCSGEEIVGKLTTNSDLVTVTRTNSSPLEVLNAIISAWD